MKYKFTRADKLTACLALGAALAAAALADPSESKADPMTDVVMTLGPAVCADLDANPSYAGVGEIGAVLSREGFSDEAAAAIINQSVLIFCPRHWAMIDAIGDSARADGAAAPAPSSGRVGGRIV